MWFQSFYFNRATVTPVTHLPTDKTVTTVTNFAKITYVTNVTPHHDFVIVNFMHVNQHHHVLFSLLPLLPLSLMHVTFSLSFQPKVVTSSYKPFSHSVLSLGFYYSTFSHNFSPELAIMSHC